MEFEVMVTESAASVPILFESNARVAGVLPV